MMKKNAEIIFGTKNIIKMLLPSHRKPFPDPFMHLYQSLKDKSEDERSLLIEESAGTNFVNNP